MASLMTPLRRTLLARSKTLPFPQLLRQNSIFSLQKKLELSSSDISSPAQTMVARNYTTELRNSAFDDKILRLIRNEIEYELDRYPPKQPITKFGSFTVDDRPGQHWIRLKKTLPENEEIRVEATMFDGAAPISKSGVPGIKENVKLHITMIVHITKGDDDTLEIVCSAWPDSIQIKNLFISRKNKTPSQPYVGPGFKELDDELQDELYEFLEARGIDDEMAVFLHEYMKNKDRTECVRWLDTVKSYIAEK